MYNIIAERNIISYSPETLEFQIRTSNTVWKWGETPFIVAGGKKLSFSTAHCESRAKRTGVADGVEAEYSGLRDENGVEYGLTVYTFMWVNNTTFDVNFEVRVEGDRPGQIQRLCYPAPLEFGAREGHGYTVLPRMQGTIVPAGQHINIADGRIQERDGYMAFFGQVRDGAGYCAIYDTPYDCCYYLPSDMAAPYFITSLGTVRYKRRMTYTFIDDCDYVKIAKRYREYIRYKGQLITLEEKIARNPNVAYLIGTPIVHEGIAVHISPESNYYDKTDPSKNDYYTSFAERAAGLRALKERGVERAYLHLDGWGKHGYDNLHPDVFPPNEAAGGADGMRGLSDTCREIGYKFGIHDQYRDYYYDGATFDFANCVENLDGSHPFCSVWYGGPHSWLCASLAPYYVRRNYDEFERLGIKIDGSYLDVFSVVALDECLSKDHPMSREQCAMYRRECFDILTAKGIIPSSEESIDSVIPSLALCHHAPYFTSNLGSVTAEPVGIHVPLFNLVYHDCMVIPWFGTKRGHGGWGIPGRDSAYLHALLNGGTIYYGVNSTAEDIEFGKAALSLHKRVARQELVSHEIIDGNVRRQRSVFADGTAVEVNFDDDSFEIK